ncbi:hypothetical protein [Haloglycomyces albus]|uniref:hypothetical protein n=1 Tax=Haloglycomyces albus TaxID=526067 RepID=UPI00046D1DDB|nr:hypothetical protein [Haloglycomyces albus]
MRIRGLSRFSVRQLQILAAVALCGVVGFAALLLGYATVAWVAVFAVCSLLIAIVLIVKNRIEHQIQQQNTFIFEVTERLRSIDNKVSKDVSAATPEHNEFSLRRILAAVENERFENAVRHHEVKQCILMGSAGDQPDIPAPRKATDRR